MSQLFAEVYDENFRDWLIELTKLVQQYDVVTEKQAFNVVNNNIDAFEDCYLAGASVHEAYNEYNAG